MILPQRPTMRSTCWLGMLVSGILWSFLVTNQSRGEQAISRQATFELTFANQDLIWLGDPGSPISSVFVKPSARPIATDFHVTTLVERDQSPVRQYMHEARIIADGDSRTVHAFTDLREKVIGVIDSAGRFAPNDFYRWNRKLLHSWPPDASVLRYDPEQNALYFEVDIPGPVLTESLDFLPLDLVDSQGKQVAGRFRIEYAPSGDAGGSPIASLRLDAGGESVTIATAALPRAFRRSDVQLGSYDNQSGTYLPEAAYRAGGQRSFRTTPSVTFSVLGELTSSVQADGRTLVLLEPMAKANSSGEAPARIRIDGNFDDWRNVRGVDDRRGDLVPYLEYVPDVDLLEFKVAHDDEHIYLYARVAGQVGRSHPGEGRSYFYAYMDVDQNPGTGFLPTRDDNCYFGVDIGDDCEVQFEFVENVFRKTFYGFCGIGGNENVLKRQLTIGKSHYGRVDDEGNARANYKAEYIYRDGVTEITEDLKHGTSDTIFLAISPDGSEVEVASTFTGFLQDPQGKPTVALGQTIDLAAGMECDSKAYVGKTRWAADSTIAIRGYQLTPSNPQ